MYTKRLGAFIPFAVIFFALLLLACDLSALAGVATKPPMPTHAVPPVTPTTMPADTPTPTLTTLPDGSPFPLPGDAEIVPVVQGFYIGFATQLIEPQLFDFYTTWLSQRGWVRVAPTEAVVNRPHQRWRKDNQELLIELQPPDAKGRSVAWVLVSARPTPTPAPIPGALPPASPQIPTGVSTVRPTTASLPGHNPNPTTVARKPATPFAPADLPFHIDCRALDPSRKPECDRFIANTRDLVYPLLRDITGTALSRCYAAVYYKIVPDEQLSTHRGEADKNRIVYSLRATLDAAPAPLYDAHELLHTISFCSGALDQHVFHGAIENQVDLTLTGHSWQNPGRERVANWLTTKLVPDVKKMGNATPAPGEGRGAKAELCERIFGDLVLILHYDAGIAPIKQLYRATINTGSVTPNAQLSRLFGGQAKQFQVVVNALKQNPKFPIPVPECGY